MIVVTNDFDLVKLHELYKTQGDVRAYVDSLVPLRYQHNPAFSHNTRYYLNQIILSSKEFSLAEKQWFNIELTKSLHVVGFMGTFILVDDMERFINMSKVEKLLKGGSI